MHQHTYKMHYVSLQKYSSGFKKKNAFMENIFLRLELMDAAGRVADWA